MKAIFVIASLLACFSVTAQKSLYNIDKGARPFIDLSKVPDSAFEAGKISIKFLPQYSFYLNTISKDENNNIIFHIPAVDSLNKKYHITSTEQIFAINFKEVELEQQHKAWGLHLWFTFNSSLNNNVKEMIAAYQSLKVFEVVEPKYKIHLLDDNYSASPFTPNDIRFNEQWNYKNTGQGGGIAGRDISLTNAWDIETGNPNIIVAVVDQGVQLDHVDLAQNIATGLSFNFTNNTNIVVPGGHGTHTSGTIGAVNNNGIGVSGIAGGNGNTNSGIRIMGCQIFSPTGNGGEAPAFIYSADHGAAISSNSWAYTTNNVYDIAILDAIDYFIANGGGNAIKGGLVVFAAGNSGQPNTFYPSAYDRVIAVAATNNKDYKTFFSTYGSWVDIAAPGGEFGGVSDILSTDVSNTYSFNHGTSMSCPHVAGVAALVASQLIGKGSASDIRDILLSTADNIDSLNPNFIGRIGSGRLNAFKAVQKAHALATANSVLPVQSFSATQSCNQFNLVWTKNIANNDVIIAYSSSNNIGSVTDGTVYNVGNNVGGGTIIYKGNASSFSFNAANNGLYNYFKIWSINNNQYSLSRSFENTVMPTIVNSGSGALQENFNYPPYFPTLQWRTLNPDKDWPWYHTAADTSHTGAGDNYSMCMYNYQYNTNLGNADILLSPKVKVQNADSVILSFFRSYKYKHTSFSIKDSLEVVVSADCGNTYTSVWKLGGKDLATITDSSDVEWYPFAGLSVWKKETINLSSFNNADKIIVGFRSVNGKGNNLFIDNVNIDVRYKRDAAMVSIISPINSTCNTQITPQIKIQNKGNDAITSLKLNYTIDGGNVTSLNWAGNLLSDSFAVVSFPSATIASGKHLMVVYTSSPNNNTDNFLLNDSLRTSFTINAINNLLLKEGFENSSFPPANWQIQQSPIDSFLWNRTTLAAKTSAASVFAQNFQYSGYAGNIDDLLTPVYNIADFDSVFLKFAVAHATKANPTDNVAFDTLQIDYTTDCGNTWNTIYKKWGTSLQTINQTQPYTIEFIPAQNQWRTDSVNLTSLLQKGNNIQFRFRNTENNGNNLYLDNINFYTKYVPPLLKQNGYIIYPNPFSNKFIVQHLIPPTTLQGVNVYNSSGQRVLSIHYNGNAASNLTIDMNAFANGLYSVELIYSDKTISQKVLKLH